MPARRRFARWPGLLIALAAAGPASAGTNGPEPAPASPQALPAAPTRRLQEVTVTATRGERDVLEVPGNVTVIDREAIERSGARDVPELLRREAGLFVTNDRSNPEGYTVEARGFNNGGGNGSSLLVLVDGRRVNETDSSVVDWSLVQLDRVERIEIVRGPASAVWGDNAVGGVIQIFTRPAEGPPRFTLRGRTGSDDWDGGSLLASGSHGPVGAMVFLDRFGTDGFRDRSDYRARHADGKLRWDVGERLALELAGGYTSDDRNRPGVLDREEIERFGRDGADPATDANRNAARVRWVQGLLEAVLAEDVVLEVRPFQRLRNDDARVQTEDPFVVTDFLAETETDATGVNAQLSIDLPVAGRRNRLLVGFDWLREEVERHSVFAQTNLDPPPPATTVFPDETDAHRRLYGGFLQEEFSLTESVLLSAGLRFDHARYQARARVPGPTRQFHSTFQRWSPKAAVTWRVGQPVSVYASFARGVRFPNFDETFGFFGFTPELRPERSTSYEAGLKLRSDRVAVNLAVYHMVVKDEILFDHEIDAFGFPSPQNVNLDRVRHRGLEASWSVRPLDWLDLYGSYTLDDARIQQDSLTGLDGKRIPLTPRHRGSVGVRVELPWALEAGLNGNLVGSRFVANDLRNEFFREGKYATWDAHAAFRPSLGAHVELAFLFRVRNLLDRKYTEVAGEGTFSRGVFGFNPAADRTYEAGVSVTWKR